jgi:hypothetical protein
MAADQRNATRRLWAAAIVLLTSSLVGCSSSDRGAQAPVTTGTGGDKPSSSPTTTTAGGAVGSLPQGCDGGTPGPEAVVTFVAGGRAWAVSPDDPARLQCLFPVADPGIFSWGPRGDRVALTGLEVRGVGTTLSRPRSDLHPSYYSWSRPTGTTVVFTDQARHRLSRADVGSPGTRDITPLPDATYGDVAYHPSGLAIGFVVNTPDGSEIWMATNQGKDPDRKIQADSATFGHLVFKHDGKGLYYSVDRPDGTHDLADYNFDGTGLIDFVWTGPVPVHDVVELDGIPGLALTVGSGCAEYEAVFSPGTSGAAARPLSTGVPGPTSVVGRLDADRFVVLAGGCGGPGDLYLVHLSGQPPVLLARGVDAAALRQAEPTPPPPLPADLPAAAFG